MDVSFSEEALSSLRIRVESDMSSKRFVHTVAVEDMVIRLAALYCPEKTAILRAAALLHDTTKELEMTEQLEICRRKGIPVLPGDELAPKIFHAKTAAVLIPDNYSEFAHPEVISAVRWHTTGREGMTVEEMLLYLADYIDESRTFSDCISLRHFFWHAHPSAMSPKERMYHLWETMILSYDMTVRSLIADGTVISSDTVLARNDLIRRRAEHFKNDAS